MKGISPMNLVSCGRCLLYLRLLINQAREFQPSGDLATVINSIETVAFRHRTNCDTNTSREVNHACVDLTSKGRRMAVDNKIPKTVADPRGL